MKIQDQGRANALAPQEREQKQRAQQRDGQGSSFSDKLKRAQDDKEQRSGTLTDPQQRATLEEGTLSRGERAGESSAQGLGQGERGEVGERVEEEGRWSSLAEEREQSALSGEEVRVADDDQERFDQQASLQHVDQQQVQGQHQVQTQTESVASSQATDRQAVVQLVEKLVRSCQVGQDQKARRVMLMEVELPGRGTVHVRLQQQRQGVEVRFRARDEATAQLLRTHQGQLEEGLRGRGVEVNRISISAT